jgi:hypothetical protein
MLDSVRFPGKAERSREHIGGPSTFAYSGIKLYTDKVMQASHVGEDYHKLFDPWIEKNGVEKKGFDVKCDHCNHSWLLFKEDGTYTNDPEQKYFRSDWMQDFGYMKISPEEIGRWTSEEPIKGIYLAQNVDYVFWRKLEAVRRRDGFTMMWEMEAPSSYYEYMDAVLNAAKTAELFSINIQEASNLFRVSTDEDIIAALQKMPFKFTLFRVGERGAYAVTPDAAFFLPPAPGPVVDPTGCGNTSTGSALYAWCEGNDPLMTGIMANVGASMNIRQYGVIPDFSAVRDEAFELAKQLYSEYSKKYGIKS